MSHRLPRRRLDRGGAGPEGEPVAVGELGHVADADVGQHAGGHDRPDTRQFHQDRAAVGDHHLQLLRQGPDALLDRDQVAELLGREATAGLPDQVSGRTEARIALACRAVMSSFACPGVSSARSRWRRLAVWVRAGRAPRGGRPASAAPLARGRAPARGVLWRGPRRPRPSARRGRRSSGRARCQATEPGQRTWRARRPPARHRIRGIAGFVGGEPTRRQHPLVVVDDLDRGRQLVRVDPDDDSLHVLPRAGPVNGWDGEVLALR